MSVNDFNYLPCRLLLEGHVELFLQATNKASMDKWMEAINNVISGYHIKRTIVEEVEKEATVLLTESEQTCETLCLIFKFW